MVGTISLSHLWLGVQPDVLSACLSTTELFLTLHIAPVGTLGGLTELGCTASRTDSLSSHHENSSFSAVFQQSLRVHHPKRLTPPSFRHLLVPRHPLWICIRHEDGNTGEAYPLSDLLPENHKLASAPSGFASTAASSATLRFSVRPHSGCSPERGKACSRWSLRSWVQKQFRERQSGPSVQILVCFHLLPALA